jgi:hypothetical protein
MRQSVIGIFEYRRDAIRARDEVRAIGVADVDLNLMPADEIGPEGLNDDELDRYEDAISLLVDEGADEAAQLYMDALRRGSTLLTVTADEATDGVDALERVRAILRQHNVTELAGDAKPAGEQTAAEAASEKAKEG